MRRKEREMNRDDALLVIDEAEYATLAMADAQGCPYCVPVNLVRVGESLYFHAAQQGKKTDILRQNPRVCACFVCGVEILQSKYTTRYRCAVVTGMAYEVTEPSQKTKALFALSQRFCPDFLDQFDQKLARCLPAPAVWEIQIETITGKRNPNAS